MTASLDDVIGALGAPDARVLVVTGAGISAAAGLPTYRGTGGLYPAGIIPLNAIDAASRNLASLWERLADLVDGIRAASPTLAHRALAEHLPGATIVTQNVDGLHEAAASPNILAMHGSLAVSRCIHPGARHRYPIETTVDPTNLPRCPVDGSRLRPDIVLFGERLDPDALTAATTAAREASVVLAIGTSLQVHPVAGLVTTALDAGALGAWLDHDPAKAMNGVASDDYASFRRLFPVPGDVQGTVTSLLRGSLGRSVSALVAAAHLGAITDPKEQAP